MPSVLFLSSCLLLILSALAGASTCYFVRLCICIAAILSCSPPRRVQCVNVHLPIPSKLPPRRKERTSILPGPGAPKRRTLFNILTASQAICSALSTRKLVRPRARMPERLSSAFPPQAQPYPDGRRLEARTRLSRRGVPECSYSQPRAETRLVAFEGSGRPPILAHAFMHTRACRAADAGCQHCQVNTR